MFRENATEFIFNILLVELNFSAITFCISSALIANPSRKVSTNFGFLVVSNATRITFNLELYASSDQRNHIASIDSSPLLLLS